VRGILSGEGLPAGHVYMVAGNADTDPQFPDNPYMSPNRRVTITNDAGEPPIPVDLIP
jgi:chemotaxis protein MotB